MIASQLQYDRSPHSGSPQSSISSAASDRQKRLFCRFGRIIVTISCNWGNDWAIIRVLIGPALIYSPTEDVIPACGTRDRWAGFSG